jgi:hypothetical protein
MTLRHLCAIALVAGTILAACGGEFGGYGSGGATGGVLGNLACPELQGGAMNAQFEADAKANATIRAFVTASGDLAAVAARVEGEVGTACERMGRDLGVPPQQMAPRQNESRVAAACNAVSARMDAILRSGVSAQIKASYTPPACQVDANAEASCKAQCNVNVDPGYVKAHCDPGHLYGRCEGTCSGRCDGTCNGQCQGECQGQAGGTTAGGQCAGQCRGTCQGSCTADCHGNCNVDFKEPKCDVAMRGPSADARCDGSCRAHANLSAQCTEPRVNVTSTVNAGEMPRLIATLQANLPALLKAEVAYGQRIAGDMQVLVQTGSELPNAFGQLTAHAGACIAAAASACVNAQASLRVSVQASASVSAKAGAHGGA